MFCQVLQTNNEFGSRAYIYGYADPMEQVTVTQDSTAYGVSADANGFWKVTFNPHSSSKGTVDHNRLSLLLHTMMTLYVWQLATALPSLPRGRLVPRGRLRTWCMAMSFSALAKYVATSCLLSGRQVTTVA